MTAPKQKLAIHQALAFFFLFIQPTVIVARENVTIADCVRALIELDYEPYNFDRYPEYFRDDSIVTLPQAGAFKGADAIEEYVRFSASTSPYFESGEATVTLRLEDAVQIEDGICSFLQGQLGDYVVNPEFNAVRFEAAALVKIYYNPTERYIAEASIFFTGESLGLIFGRDLNSEQSRSFLCDIIEDTCGYSNQTDDCISALEALPVSQGGEGNYVDGNSLGCRFLHGAFAVNRPDLHCPHVSFDPIVDPNGEIKCQGDGVSIDPNTLFTEADFDYFDRFTRRNGIDPAIGYREIPLEGLSAFERLRSIVKQVFGRFGG